MNCLQIATNSLLVFGILAVASPSRALGQDESPPPDTTTSDDAPTPDVAVISCLQLIFAQDSSVGLLMLTNVRADGPPRATATKGDLTLSDDRTEISGSASLYFSDRFSPLCDYPQPYSMQSFDRLDVRIRSTGEVSLDRGPWLQGTCSKAGALVISNSDSVAVLNLKVGGIEG